MARDSLGSDSAKNDPTSTSTPSTATALPDRTTKAQEAFDVATAIAKGDARAESRMVELYEPGLRRILISRTNSKDELDDLVQDVWMKVLPKLREGELEEPAALAGYLNTFARRVAANHQRKKETLASKNKVTDPEMHWQWDADLFNDVSHEQILELVDQLIDELRMKRDQEVLRRFLVYEENKSDLCEELGLTERAFNSVLSRARQRLRELVAPYLGEQDR